MRDFFSLKKYADIDTGKKRPENFLHYGFAYKNGTEHCSVGTEHYNTNPGILGICDAGKSLNLLEGFANPPQK